MLWRWGKTTFHTAFWKSSETSTSQPCLSMLQSLSTYTCKSLTTCTQKDKSLEVKFQKKLSKHQQEKEKKKSFDRSSFTLWSFFNLHWWEFRLFRFYRMLSLHLLIHGRSLIIILRVIWLIKINCSNGRSIKPVSDGLSIFHIPQKIYPHSLHWPGRALVPPQRKMAQQFLLRHLPVRPLRC